MRKGQLTTVKRPSESHFPSPPIRISGLTPLEEEEGAVWKSGKVAEEQAEGEFPGRKRVGALTAALEL